MKCVLTVKGPESKEACGKDLLCRVLEDSIKGGIHAVRLLCQQHAHEENWAFILIDV